MAASAVFFPERLGKSARNRVLMLGRDRAEFTDHFAGIPAQIRWLELEQWPFEVRKNDQKNCWVNARCNFQKYTLKYTRSIPIVALSLVPIVFRVIAGQPLAHPGVIVFPFPFVL